MNDTLQLAINTLRKLGFEAQAKAVEQLRAEQVNTMTLYSDAQRASYASGWNDCYTSNKHDS